jgi:hypothetical protein
MANSSRDVYWAKVTLTLSRRYSQLVANRLPACAFVTRNTVRHSRCFLFVKFVRDERRLWTEVPLYMQQLVCVIRFSWVPIPTWPADSQLERTTCTNCCIYTLLPPDDGQLVSPKHCSDIVTEYTEDKQCIRLVSLYAHSHLLSNSFQFINAMCSDWQHCKKVNTCQSTEHILHTNSNPATRLSDWVK